MNLSIVVPVYNEEKVIVSTVNSINEVLRTSKVEQYEIVVVNDGSIDNTSTVLKSISQDCVIINHEKNRGLWRAIVKCCVLQLCCMLNSVNKFYSF